MLASRLSQFGLRSLRTVNVDVGIGRNAVGFGVRFYECAAADGRKLLHAELFNPDHSNEIDMFWVRVMTHFQLAAERDQARGRSVAGIESDLLRRTQLLGHVGVAFPQKYSALERRTVSVKNAQVASADELGASPLEAAVGCPDWRTEVGDSDLERFAMASLMGGCELSESDIRGYLGFEKSVRDRMLELLTKYAGPGEWRNAHKEMKAYLSSIRKNADDSQRKLLLLLQSACDIQLMHMYQFVAGAVLKTKAVTSALGAFSLAYNRAAHAAQDRLGGVVPAVHPLWTICLRTPRIVGVLCDYAENPVSAENINSVNACFTDALREYIRVLEPVITDENAVPLDATVGDGTQTAGDVTGARDRGLSVAEQGIAELVEMTRQKCGSDRDVAVAYDVVYDGLDVKAAAEKHACSPGEISKRRQRGLAKMRALLKQLGWDSADVLAALCKLPQDVVERYSPDQDRTENDDDDSEAKAVAPAGFSWQRERVNRGEEVEVEETSDQELESD